MNNKKMISVPLREMCMLQYAVKLAKEVEARIVKTEAAGRNPQEDPMLQAMITMASQGIFCSSFDVIKSLDPEEAAVISANSKSILEEELKRGLND